MSSCLILKKEYERKNYLEQKLKKKYCTCKNRVTSINSKCLEFDYKKICYRKCNQIWYTYYPNHWNLIYAKICMIMLVCAF